MEENPSTIVEIGYSFAKKQVLLWTNATRIKYKSKIPGVRQKSYIRNIFWFYGR